MRSSAQMSKQPSYVHRLGDWWRNWTDTRRRRAQSAACVPADVPPVRDVDASRAKPQVLAGKWPDCADMLSRRMPQINRNTISTRG
jgi:hypothetical protein